MLLTQLVEENYCVLDTSGSTFGKLILKNFKKTNRFQILPGDTNFPSSRFHGNKKILKEKRNFFY